MQAAPSVAVHTEGPCGQVCRALHLNNLIGVHHSRVAVQQVQALHCQAAPLVQQLLLEGAWRSAQECEFHADIRAA